ncbi:MAG: indolepyruvate ferredoxin oxidoreductase subunit alpha [Candidatus Edwardsbacteria bacterium RIFOXYD12_FULL_50_11]|uniref:Indolepyruvate oxidoreductase subunit IorA n=1 Tax=Candidatus Edwardsbacteria bacterium GWF2_54_11 TaxID=1817851 RepID=A0A1F5RGA8_9BACT|nr:MAG: indolepyruvate ferredoxin oxidoreductase subunit alpha [Candidatus Edwardsbacteria bacterium RifOxyC12_full_54_24]OGF07070.1 MAG: indolepyruvate ferredoxin oxidoreductase subunit alpha [Candidatus Edwardsbacteria bacterium RifOxyA12_full_54_48]OGF10965.1 MAG: indolepyruvate ferredoxin oxidoreductase subunit alpha [Candidatus Edwardsbacteria bacterium GWE2_54_12]OGF13153.1 MAG: indolepyruvate ferredoxin oxidoreductase subunit alpha [Candidatus Edwardsbacteria bacterium GWF2_54_11]OGF1591
MKMFLSGNEAVARGAWEAGVNVVSAYPGTPSTEILENLGKYKEIYAELATNEKVGLEVAAGASFAGARALTCMKHVGLNVAADPLFSMAYIGARGGLVVVSADDPGMHSSQNEQDNRYYAKMAKIPCLEPSDSQECLEMAKLAFDLSEKFDTPVLLRLTTRISHSKGVVETGERTEHQPTGYVKDVAKNITIPAHARKMHVKVEERLKKLAEYGEQFSYNKVEKGEKKLGIITSGISYQYAKDVFPKASFLKLSLTFPLPIRMISEFINSVEEIYVIEENDTFLEEQIKAAGYKISGSCAYDKEITGKAKIPIAGELDPTVLARAFGLQKESPYKPLELPARPPVLCPGCPHRGVFYALNKLKLTVTGDIGCYTLGMMEPLNAMDTVICMGGSVTAAMGLEKALGPEMAQKTVAVIGDSTFFHSGITGLVDMVYNNSQGTVIILDNRITAMTGHQENPGTGKTLQGQEAPIVELEPLVRSCGVKHVQIVDPLNLKQTEAAIKEAISNPGVSVIIAKSPCILIEKKYKPALKVDQDKCVGCKICLKLGCPAISFDKDKKKSKIDPMLCIGCEVCASLCPKQAMGHK